ncbi:hypothetical protein [Streptomyces sp. NPDC058861]|uniref:hypothetical protein n=1 Tax=Streptomyces sp. NPDC058861 TaxID=3346653 RepID=UPI00368915FA
MSKQPRRGRQWRDREIKQVRRERGISHTAAMRIVDAERAAAGAPLPAWVRPKGLHVGERWSEQDTPFTPPPGVPPLADPYGHAHDSAAAGYLLTFTVPDREEAAGYSEVWEAIVYAHRFLVVPGRGWMRAAVGVYGPLPFPVPNSSDAETPEGYVTVTVMVEPYARLAPGLEGLKGFMDASWDAATAAVLEKYPAPAAGLEPEALTVEVEMLQSLRERLEPRTLSWMYLHPTLAEGGPAYETYPERIVDIRSRGWSHTGRGRYAVDFREERGLPERTYDELAAIDGPLSVVEPPYPGNAEEVVERLVEAGERAAGSLLVALHRLDASYREWSAESGEPTCSLTAGQEEAWETKAMMDLVRGQGAVLAGQPARYSETAVTELHEELEGWTGVSQAYTEVAQNLAVLFGRAAEAAGGWAALADAELRTLAPAKKWLMSRSTLA